MNQALIAALVAFASANYQINAVPLPTFPGKQPSAESLKAWASTTAGFIISTYGVRWVDFVSWVNSMQYPNASILLDASRSAYVAAGGVVPSGKMPMISVILLGVIAYLLIREK